MQDVIFYVAAGETLCAVRDYANAKGVPPPTLVRLLIRPVLLHRASGRIRGVLHSEGGTP